MKAILVDDETRARSLLRKKIQENCSDIDVVGEAGNIPEAVKSIHATSPDLVFLDIDMPGQNGFALFDYFDKISFQVIFVTASQEHALKAFRVSALDYLLKPIQSSQLESAVEKAKEQVNSRLAERVHMLSYTLSQEADQPLTRIALSTNQSVEFVNLEDILYLKADGPYTEFHLEGGHTVLVSNSIGEYEYLQDHPDFLKTHRSYLINLTKVQRYIKEDGGYIVMSNGAEAGLSRYRKKVFMEAMEQH